MNKIIAFIRKNLVFLIMLILLTITIVVFVYLLINKNAKQPIIPPTLPQEEELSSTNKEDQIWVSGDYRRNGQIIVVWSLNIPNETIRSVRLFYGEQQLGGEMKNLTTYALEEQLYQFPTGENKFTLYVDLNNGKQLKKDFTVEISPVVNISMNSERKEDALFVQLNYMYDPNHPVKIPYVLIPNGSDVNWNVFYESTIRKTGTTLETATTTYRISLASIPEGTYDLTLRWHFEGLNISEDFSLTITK